MTSMKANIEAGLTHMISMMHKGTKKGKEPLEVEDLGDNSNIEDD